MPNSIHHAIRSALLALPLLAFTAQLRAAEPLDSVDPRIGTDEHGHVFPGATMPMGMVQISPDTREGTWDGAAGYHYSDHVILGFSHTHLSGTGVGDLGDIRLMPTVGEVRWDSGNNDHPGYRSEFKHDDEQASPGYYRVKLADYDVTAELTSTERAGLQRYTFPQSDAAHVILDLTHGVGGRPVQQTINVENDHTISGLRSVDGWGGRRMVYFVMEFSAPFTGSTIRVDGHDVDGKTAQGRDVRAHFDFRTTAGQQVVVRTGISTVSVDGARKNLEAEVKDFDFDATRAKAEQAWTEALNRVQVNESDRARRRTFYTALYRTLMAPTLLSDVDGQYRGPDGQVHKADGYNYYTELSLWDTFRAEHPLLTITQPERVNDFVRTFLDHADNQRDHMLPVWVNWGRENWCMIGNHSIPVITEAYNKGFRGFDAKRALDAMVRSVEDDKFDKKLYRDLGGWLPQDPPHGRQAVSKTLEYAYDDACIGRLATALGETDVAKKYDARGDNWRHFLDPDTHLMRPKNPDGSWVSPFNPAEIEFRNYTEANAWQYSFFVPQNVPGLMQAMGGPDVFVKQLDTMFDTTEKIPGELNDVTGVIGMYAHGNEPCQHVAYLYNYAGRPDQTAKRVRHIATTLYNDTPAGLCGNDDCGQTSAWYVFSALGFYPVDPASGIYQIGSPLFGESTLQVKAPTGGEAKTFKVVAENNSPTNLYIQSATLNGQPLNRSWLSHAEIVGGGELHLVMGDKPSDWAKEVAPMPAAPAAQ